MVYRKKTLLNSIRESIDWGKNNIFGPWTKKGENLNGLPYYNSYYMVSGDTYIIGEKNSQENITCLYCNLTSYNTNDIDNLFCGNCKIFHNDNKNI